MESNKDGDCCCVSVKEKTLLMVDYILTFWSFQISRAVEGQNRRVEEYGTMRRQNDRVDIY